MKINTSLRCLACALLVVAAISGCDDGVSRDEIDDAIDEGQQDGFDLRVFLDEDLGGADELVAMGTGAQVMLAIDEAEIFVAQAALEVCEEDVVCDYASSMIDEHTLHAAMLQDLVARLEVPLVESRVADAIREDAEDDAFDVVTAIATDIVYMELQVRMHEEAFVLVGSFDPYIDQPDFVRFLLTTQDIIAEHSLRAQAILRAL